MEHIREEKLREILRKYMHNHPMSLSNASRQIGIGLVTLGSFLNNNRPPRDLTMRLIEKFLRDRGVLPRVDYPDGVSIDTQQVTE